MLHEMTHVTRNWQQHTHTHSVRNIKAILLGKLQSSLEYNHVD